MIKKYFYRHKNCIRFFSAQIQKTKAAKKEWKSVIGLEVHAQIATESKLFSGSSTTFGAPLNTSVSYFDASIPGTLPVLNEKCVKFGIKTALALGCRINEVSMFDRKHYFYADLPAGYQITQQRAALANDGEIIFPVIIPGKKIYYKKTRLLQLQLEQDSGKSLHDNVMQRSLVDLNRAGMPLMELVFAPDLETGEEAASLIKELILILRCLQTCTCKMEEGALRVDANISIHKPGDPLGTRTEVKNIGSVRSISQAISFEIERQLAILAKGDSITNETRSWDAEQKCTIAMRDKEVLQDYRFLPEPNLPPLRLNVSTQTLDIDAAVVDDVENELISVMKIKNEIPELPEQTRQRLIDEFKLNQETVIILVNEPILLDYFRNILKNFTTMPAKTITNFLLNDLLTFCNKLNIDVDQCNLNYIHLKDILKSLQTEEINLDAARALIGLIHANPNAHVNELIETHNLQQLSDLIIIDKLCKEALENQPKAVKNYKNGKTKAFYAIVGEVAKLSKNKANMKLVVKHLEQLLKSK